MDNQTGQISNNWGNPQWIADFRTKAIPQYGAKPVEEYITSQQTLFKQQQGQAVTGAIGANQGAITNEQAQQDPTGALKFLNGGGQLLNVGPDAQKKAISDAASYFSKHSDKNGYVKPDDYNKFLAQYGSTGGDSKDFESKFGDKYIDPKNAFYDTPDAKAARGALPLIKQVIDSYHKLHLTGQAVKDLSSLPIVGPYIQQNYLHAQSAHDTFLNGEIGNIRQIAGAGQGQGFRFNLQELNNISGLLPKATDNKSVANDKLDELDTYLQKNMGTSLKQLYGK